MKKIINVFAIGLAVVLSACSSNWLSQEPEGGTITEAQFQAMDNVISGSVLGVYASMYQYGGDHDVFGQRSIDMYGDFTCGDMAMASFSYGWFQTDEYGQAYTRRAYLWSYYYDIIRLCNKGINAIEVNYPNNKLLEIDNPTSEEEESGYYLAQLLGMRGWAYANLQKWFCATGKEGLSDKSVPIYTQEVTLTDETMGAARGTGEDVVLRAEEDMQYALEYFRKFPLYSSNKQEMDSTVVRVNLAYMYLNAGKYEDALKCVEPVLNESKILPTNEVLTTGFASVDNDNWLWGQAVTVETTTALASFFGQVDIFSYSYAWAGDVKGIDENLYKEITGKKWDLRAKWFNNIQGSYKYAPDGKFYSPEYKKDVAPSADEIDRDWLCDNVYMREELAYLIAAEAAYRQATPDEVKAKQYLQAITDQRVIEANRTDYETEVATWTGETLLEAIRYNWRVELWGEGYGLQTFRRFGKSVTLGSNHKRSDKTLDPTVSPRRYTFELPDDEIYYNPMLNGTTTLQENN